MTRIKITKYDIRKTCFEEINNSYSWGIYYDKNVIIMKKNGYINATKFIASIGRDEDVEQWLGDEYGLELLDALSNEVGICKNKLQYILNLNLTQILMEYMFIKIYYQL